MNKIPKVFMLLDVENTYGRGLARGIAKYAGLRGPWTFYIDPPYYRKSKIKDNILTKIKSLQINGIIMRETNQISKIVETGVPTIVTPYTSGIIPGLVNIIGDEAKMAEIAAEHLLERRFKHYAYCGFNDMYWSKQRGECFNNKIAQAGFKTYFYRNLVRTKLSGETEQLHLADWLKSLPKPIGLMACDDDCGRYLLEACRIAGLHVPEEIAILGVDNDELLCLMSNPPLSSIVHNAERAGYEAAEILSRLMAGEKITEQEIIVRPSHVISRRSTDVLAIEDREVAEAMRFIHVHAKNAIQVDQVVDAVAISRTSLQEKFRKFLGRTIHEEIKRVRVEQVCRMLAETNETVARIAFVLNYSTIEHLSRYFRQQMGMTPLEYRKKFKY